jgi:uncharacterized protein (TIGR01777 family)
MKTVLISGGTGLIGSALCRVLLQKDYSVIILTRSTEKYSVLTPKLSYAKWNIQQQVIDRSAITRSDYIIHLAGAGISDKRWTTKRKSEILESRIRSSELLIKGLRENPNEVKAVVSASGIGWYGPGTPGGEGSEHQPFTEAHPAAEDFLGQTCKEWEASIDPVTALGKRLVKFRTAIALTNEGGALTEFKKVIRFGIAPILGNGKQVMSWIHIDDLVRLYVYAIENDKLQGVYNAVAPQIVTNKKFILQLARSMRGRFFVPVFVPGFILQILRGEVSIEVLKSATVSPEKIIREGYTFLYPSLSSALSALRNQSKSI